MLYEEYRRRTELKIKQIRSAFKTLGITLIILLIAAILLSPLEYIRGTINGGIKCNSITYGDKISPELDAFLCVPEYEYKAENGEWQSAVPDEAGTYSVRGKTRNLFGVVRYSDEAEFSVLKRELTVRPNDIKALFGDNIQFTRQSFTASGLAEGDDISDFRMTIGSYDVGISEIKFEDITVTNKNGKDVTDSYVITFQTGEAEILKRPVSISSSSVTTEYSGSPISSKNYTITNGSIAHGHEIDVSFPVSVTEPGSEKNVISVKITDENGKDVTEFYDITLSFGKIIVTKISISIQTESAEKEYDKTPLKANGYKITSGSLLDGHTLLKISGKAEITNAGFCYNTMEFNVRDRKGNDVGRYYDINVNPGRLTVRQRKLVIETGSASKLYDGTRLYCKTYNIVAGSLINGDRIAISMYNDIVNVGSVPNWISFAFIDNKTNLSITDNYGVELIEGTLKILPNGSITPPEDHGDSGDSGDSGNPKDSGDPKDSGEFGLIYDEEATISKKSSKPSSKPAFSVFSYYDKEFYFKAMTYGNYNGQGFDAAKPYEGFLFPYNGKTMFPGSMYQACGGEVREVLISYREKYPKNVLLPYYFIESNLNEYLNITDTYAEYLASWAQGSSSGMPISISYAQFPDLPNFYETFPNAYEMAYREFVYDVYLSLPDSTRDGVLQYLEDNGVKKTEDIYELADIIKSAAKYNIDYKTIPDDCKDVVLYFLNESKEGVCQHFASAGVAIYRALGIPARYVTGYYANVSAKAWTDVPYGNAHAWVEVYKDGFGWIPVEVTGSGFDYYEQVDDRPKVTICSYSGVSVFDGNRFGVNAYYLSENELKKGHTLYCEVSSWLDFVGTKTNTVSNVRIYDEKTGQTVNDQYRIGLVPGEIQILPMKLTIVTGSNAWKYDGEKHSCEEYTLVSGSLPDGWVLEVNFPPIKRKGSQMNMPTSVKVYQVTESNGKTLKQDMTWNFDIDLSPENMGTITIY